MRIYVEIRDDWSVLIFSFTISTTLIGQSYYQFPSLRNNRITRLTGVTSYKLDNKRIGDQSREQRMNRDARKTRTQNSRFSIAVGRGAHFSEGN